MTCVYYQIGSVLVRMVDIIRKLPVDGATGSLLGGTEQAKLDTVI